MTAPSYTDWFVGMRVECVNDDWWYFKGNTKLGNAYPKVGNVYTIREIGVFAPHTGVALRLMEIKNPVLRWPKGEVMEMAYAVKRFRPVQTRKTDISIFTAMLSPKPAKAKKVRA